MVLSLRTLSIAICILTLSACTSVNQKPVSGRTNTQTKTSTSEHPGVLFPRREVKIVSPRAPAPVKPAPKASTQSEQQLINNPTVKAPVYSAPELIEFEVTPISTDQLPREPELEIRSLENENPQTQSFTEDSVEIQPIDQDRIETQQLDDYRFETKTINEDKPMDVASSLKLSAKKAIAVQEWKKAQPHLESALRVAPKDAEVFYLYAQVYQGLGVKAQQKNMLKRAMFLSKPNSDIYLKAQIKLNQLGP